MNQIGSRGRWAAAVALLAIAGAVGAWVVLGSGLLDGPAAKGEAAYARGDWQKAALQAGLALKLRPGDAGAKRLLARSSARLGYTDASQQIYGLLGEGAMQAEDYYLLGSGLARQDQVEPAIAVLERGRGLDAGHGELLHELARLYAASGRLGDAADAADRLADRPGWASRGSLIAGLIHRERSDPAGAASAFARALKVDPDLRGGVAKPVDARKMLGRALLEVGKPGEARPQLDAVLAAGADPEASWLLGRAFLQDRAAGAASLALARAGDFGEGDPTRPEPAPYVGARACAGCHAAIYRAEQGSRHARTFLAAGDLKAEPLPAGPIADPALPGTTHSLRRDGDAIRLTTRAEDQAWRAVVELALGSGDRGRTMVVRDDKGMARVCRISAYENLTLWDMTSHARPPQADDPGGPLGRPMSDSALAKCVDCHVTSPRSSRDRGVPEAADRGIGCERCHGPGGNHLAAVALKFPDPAIGRPSRATAAQITKLCAACHDTDDPSMAESDPRAVRFQTTTMPKSRCYTASGGGLSCLTCHDPHRDAETSAAPYEAKCLSCHAPTPGKPTAETRHAVLADGIRRVPCPVDPAKGCISCHMPKVEGAAPHARFTDHQIRVHRPAPGG